MNTPIYAYCKPGTVFFKSFPECEPGTDGDHIVKRAEQIANDIFFSVVEIGRITDKLYRTRVSRIFEYAHMEVAYATQPYFFAHAGHVGTTRYSLCHPEKAKREEALGVMVKCFAEAYDLKAQSFRVVSGYMPGTGSAQDVAEGKKALCESLHKVMELSKQWGSPLVTLKIFDYDVTSRQLIGRCEDALEIAKEICPHYENFGLLTDLSHFPLLREDVRATLTTLKDYLKGFHLGNTSLAGTPQTNPYFGDIQPRFGIPGGANTVDDVVNYFRVLKDLDLISPEKRPVVTAEVRPIIGDETQELILANNKRVFQEGWARA